MTTGAPRGRPRKRSPGRPLPEILDRMIDTGALLQWEILESEGVFAVVYQGRPIKLRTSPAYSNGNPKYRPTLCHTRGFAEKLAQTLNDKFKNDKFSVVELAPVPPPK